MTQDTPAALSIEMHEALCPAHTGGNCTCEKFDPAVDKAWAQFCAGIGDGPNAPYPGMIAAFERYYSQSFADKAWRTEAATWAAAWKAAKQAPVAGQPALRIAFTKEWCMAAAQAEEEAQADFSVGVAGQPAEPSPALLRELLEDAWTRMDRARRVLTNDNPTPLCNWGMLDTSYVRTRLAAPKGDSNG